MVILMVAMLRMQLCNKRCTMTLSIKTILSTIVAVNVFFATLSYGSGFDNGNFDKIYFDCAYSATIIHQTTSGGSIQVIAPAGCKWEAISSGSWINIIAGASGNGNGLVNYSISDIIPPQGGGIEIAGQTITISQVPDSGNIVKVPTMTEWGMIIFVLLAGLGSVFHLRKRRKVNLFRIS